MTRKKGDVKRCIKKTEPYATALHTLMDFDLNLDRKQIQRYTKSRVMTNAEKKDYLMVQCSFILLNKEQKVAVFKRAMQEKGKKRITTGGSILVSMPLPEEEEVKLEEWLESLLSKSEGRIDIRSLKPYGYGRNFIKEIEYVFLIYKAVVEAEGKITISGKEQDQFQGFYADTELEDLIDRKNMMDQVVCEAMVGKERHHPNTKFYPHSDYRKRAACILLLDICGFSAMTHAQQVLSVSLMTKLIESKLDTLGSLEKIELISTGDGYYIMAPYEKIGDLFQFTKELYRSFRDFNKGMAKMGDKVELKYVLHSGINYQLPLETRINYLGDAMNMASRIQASCWPGQILVSVDAQSLIIKETGEKPGKFGKAYEIEVKGREEPLYIYSYYDPGEPIGRERTPKLVK